MTFLLKIRIGRNRSQSYLVVEFLLSLVIVPFSASHGGDDSSRPMVYLGVFTADITPPLGDGVGIGFMPETLSVEHEIQARGIVLRDAGGTYVLCALDSCGLCNDSYDLFRNEIARAVEAQPDRVAVQSLHQHTAPIYDTNGSRILYRDDPEKLARRLEFTDRMAHRVADAAGRAMKSPQLITHVGTSKAKVERVASNRRVPQPDGTIRSRMSSTRDPTLHAAPEGLIDPWLRTVTFYQGNQPLVQLHYYATHPQTFYRDGRISYDVPGIALERLQRETSISQIYFTGCAGNVTMGKYNDGERETRDRLANRLYSAMARSAAQRGNRHNVTKIRWKSTNVTFPLRHDESFSAETQHRILADSTSSFRSKLKAASMIAWIERVQAGRDVAFSSLSIGKVKLLQLPGEPFVQFQLIAQQAAEDAFVAVAGYGDCAMWYIGEDRIYTDQGGMEQSWAFAGPCQQLVESTIRELLQP